VDFYQYIETNHNAIKFPEEGHYYLDDLEGFKEDLINFADMYSKCSHSKYFEMENDILYIPEEVTTMISSILLANPTDKELALENQKLQKALLKKIVEAPTIDLTHLEEQITDIKSGVTYVEKIYQKGKEKVKPKNKGERHNGLKNKILTRGRNQK
jgi:regulator of replication initiation timing